MKAQKVTVTITVEGLSIDILRGQLIQAANQILDHENISGSLISDDGDTVTWETKKEPVEF